MSPSTSHAHARAVETLISQLNSTATTLPSQLIYRSSVSKSRLGVINGDSDPKPPINITVDASIRIVGHCNDLHLPSQPIEGSTKLAATIALALKHAGATQAAHGGRRPINIRVQGGTSICGSRNTVAIGSRVGKKTLVMKKDDKFTHPTMDRTEEYRESEGRKRRAQSEPADSQKAKKVMAEV
ncbi:hypothetical protein MMC06_004754 [Schaereria dolodes]|nr:hypothetical protein [Schaereria dolodes]